MTLAYRLLAYAGLALALFVIGFAGGYHVAAQAGKAKVAQIEDAADKEATIQQAALAAAQTKLLAQQQAAEQQLAAIQQTYEQDQAHAKAQSDATIAALRAGTLRLRNEWNTCAATASPADMSQATAGRPSAADAAQLRDQDASALVRNADDADAEIRALQAIIIQDRR